MTIIEFYDRNAIENVVSTLLCHPEQVVFVGDSKRRLNAAVENCRTIAEGRGLAVEFFTVTIGKNNLTEIVQTLTQLNTRQINPGALPTGIETMLRSFVEKAGTLSSAERRILNYYIDGHDIAEIPELAFISIHTVKKHNRSIYQKLGVASRDELMLYIELFRCCDRLEELTGAEAETE
mgnify:CR=1 FL=1